MSMKPEDLVAVRRRPLLRASAIALIVAGSSVLFSTSSEVAATQADIAVLDCVDELDTQSYLRWAVEGDGAQAENAYVKGCALYKGAYYTRALRALDEAVALNPALDVAHVYRGLVLGALGRVEEAVHALDRGIAAAQGVRTDPSWFSQPRLHKAAALLQLGKPEPAIVELTKVIAHGPTATVYGLRAQAYLARAATAIFPEEAQDDLRRADADLDKGIELAPKDARFWVLKANVQLMLGEDERACQTVRRACELGDCRLAEEFVECR